MPEIKAFRGWRYDPGKVKNFSAVCAPPYDVISPKEQGALYRKSPYNVIRLELGKKERGDSARRNSYTRASDFLRRWKSDGVLVRESMPALYVYRQDWGDGGRPYSRLGFLAAMTIDEKAVLKHENTLAGPKKDRLALLKETRTNLSPIWGLFEDGDRRVGRALGQTLKTRPAVDIAPDGVRHRLYVETRPGVVDAVADAMRRKPMFIADGHHRFEVSCRFRDWMRSQRPHGNGDAAWERVLVYFSDCLHHSFKIYPTHRLIRTEKKGGALLGALEKAGALRPARDLSDILGRLSKCRPPLRRRRTGAPAYDFGVYAGGKKFYRLTLDPRRLSENGRPTLVDRLDVSALHRRVLEPCYGIREVEKSRAIDFTRDPREAVRRVRRGEFDLAFFLRPTSLAEMIEVSRKNLKMPQKSTYFYPKLLSGLVFHGLDDD
ncbi:MAG: DUF1015 domain-containing protein [Candidatus Omnitrophica bacterium]|nr:DUF1015 domain-containing protein [Candidatus Omnitrophota bacterium]